MRKFACLFSMLAALPAFAAVNTCPVTTGSLSRTFTGGPTYSNVTVPGDSTTNNLGSLGTAGCTTIDLAFSNFGLSSTGTNEGNLPFAAGTYVSVTPTGTTQTGPDTLLFSTLQGDGSANSENATTATPNDGVDNFKVNESESFTTTMSYGVTDGLSTGIYGVILTVNDITVATGGSGTVTIDTCAKGTGTVAATGNITSQAACNTAVHGTGVFQSVTMTLAQEAAESTSLSLTGHPTYIDVTQIVTLTCASCGTDETGFLTFSNEFLETPEPSTFFLLGAGICLAGLGRRLGARFFRLAKS